MDKDYLDDTHRSEFSKASRWLQNRGEILKVFKKIEESSKVSNNYIFKGDVGVVGDGNNVGDVKQKNTNITVNITNEQQADLLEAIKQIKEQNDLNNKQLQKIAELQAQVENGKLEPSLFNFFSNAFGIAGSVASIASLTPMIMKAVG